jgi:hypothetical protein
MITEGAAVVLALGTYPSLHLNPLAVANCGEGRNSVPRQAATLSCLKQALFLSLLHTQSSQTITLI